MSGSPTPRGLDPYAADDGDIEPAPPGTWAYRVVSRHFPEEDTYHIHEVYYRADGSIAAWGTEPAPPTGGSLEELLEDVGRQMQALNKPVLDYDDLPDFRRPTGSSDGG